MRNVKFSDLIGKSYDRTIGILFKPFSAKKWLKFLLIAFLAGALAGGNGPGGGGGGSNQPQNKQGAKKTSVQSPQSGQGSGQTEKIVSQSSASPSGANAGQTVSQSKPVPAPPPILFILIITGIIILLVVALITLMTWVGSRFRFVWLNAVVNNDSSILEPYSRHWREANSLFKFSIFIFIAFLIFMVIDIGGVLFTMAKQGAFDQKFAWSFPIALKIFLLPGLLLILVFIILIILSVIIDVFVVPIMAFDGIRLGAALRKFGNIFASNRRDIILFLLLLLLLGIIAGAVQMALLLVVLLVVVLAGLVILGLPLFILSIFKAYVAMIILGAALGVPFLVVAILIFIATALPFAVFFRLFSVNYLLSLDCGYTEASLAGYASRKAECVSKTVPVVLITSLFVIGFAFLFGLLAAIAIPNIMRAREEALKKKNSGVVSAVYNISNNIKIS